MSNNLSNEIKLEYNLQKLQKNEENILVITKKTHVQSETLVTIELTLEIDKDINNNNQDEDYVFILFLNITSNKIHLYSKNYKPFDDGRDLIYDVCPEIVGKNNFYDSETKLEPILKSLKEFVNNKEREKPTSEIGKFYLGNYYDIDFITSLPNKKYFINKINLKEIVNNKQINILCLCVISEEYFCLYEYNKKNKNKIKLIFFSLIKSLISFKQNINLNILTLIWKQYNNKFDYEMQLSWNDVKVIDNIIDVIISYLKSRGLQMDIVKKQREGELPKIDIYKIESEIPRLELQMKYACNLLLFNKLLYCYEKSVEYYSAANNDKYILFTKKIQDLLKDDKYKKFYS